MLVGVLRDQKLCLDYRRIVRQVFNDAGSLPAFPPRVTTKQNEPGHKYNRDQARSRSLKSPSLR